MANAMRVGAAVVIAFLLGSAGCVDTVEQYAGLSCVDDSTCPEPLACVNGACGVRPIQGTCRTDGDCPDGLVCHVEGGFCRQCGVDSDCAAGRCLDGRFCVPCLGNADCGDGQYCDESTHTCRGA
ncbi:MAG: hypothetical protein H6816_16100 [Phycisphaerales bacterium]|nr:hypothetical protein [Phycisphaerales bacterium]